MSNFTSQAQCLLVITTRPETKYRLHVTGMLFYSLQKITLTKAASFWRTITMYHFSTLT